MSSQFELSRLGNLVVILTLLLLVALGLPSLDFFGQTMNYLPTHGVAESASIVAMLAVVAIYVRHRHHPEAGKLAVLAAGCLAVGLIDAMHTMSYEGMPIMITPSNPQKAINFWLAGRLALALTLITVIFAPPQPPQAVKVAALFALSVAISAVVFWVGVFYEASLPATFVRGEGLTPVKIAAEIVIALMFVWAAWRFAKMRQSHTGIDWRMMAASAWIFALAEIYLCMYSDVTDIFNLAGHSYKLIAAVLLFLAVKPVTRAPPAVAGA